MDFCHCWCTKTNSWCWFSPQFRTACGYEAAPTCGYHYSPAHSGYLYFSSPYIWPNYVLQWPLPQPLVQLTQVCSSEAWYHPNGPPVSARPRHLAPERLLVAKQEFEHMMQLGIVSSACPLHCIWYQRSLPTIGVHVGTIMHWTRILSLITIPSPTSTTFLILCKVPPFSPDWTWWVPITKSQWIWQISTRQPSQLHSAYLNSHVCRLAYERGPDSSEVYGPSPSWSSILLYVHKWSPHRQQFTREASPAFTNCVWTPQQTFVIFTARLPGKLRQFIVLVKFYHWFLPHGAELMQPLHALLTPTKPKARPLSGTTQPWLPSMPPKKPWLMPLSYTTLCQCPSDTAAGVVLQQHVAGTWCPISFFSKKLKPSETRYSTFDLTSKADYSMC